MTWKKQHGLTNRAVCLQCDEGRTEAPQRNTPSNWSQKMCVCADCDRQLPPQFFDAQELRKLIASNEICIAQCETCKPRAHDKEKSGCLCTCCKSKTAKSLNNFSTARRHHPQNTWICLECEFPPCSVCQKIPETSEQKPYTCNACTVHEKPQWKCAEGKRSKCQQCGANLPKPAKQSQRHCAACRLPPRLQCGKARPKSGEHSDYTVERLPQWTWTECRKRCDST